PGISAGFESSALWVPDACYFVFAIGIDRFGPRRALTNCTSARADLTSGGLIIDHTGSRNLPFVRLMA
ncbi:hypothetical protein, partial [Paraburkholderia sp. RL18-085-BIA-A]|uniref:hypothetical protein n=1 Tax=Paraburkholderia sp. RL18-085-BIA-A TaxID=3031633 RepID=UPI0038BA966F